MTGQIHESACSIHTDDTWQEIPFGTVSQRSVENNDSQTIKPLRVRLINCVLERKNGSFWNDVEVTFDGEKDSSTPTLFAVNGNAEGIGLRIYDYQGISVAPGEVLPSVELKEGGNEINYNLGLITNGKLLKEGDWFSTIKFVVAYQ